MIGDDVLLSILMIFIFTTYTLLAVAEFKISRKTLIMIVVVNVVAIGVLFAMYGLISVVKFVIS